MNGKFIEETLGINAVVGKSARVKLPKYFDDMYIIKKGKLENNEVIFVEPRNQIIASKSLIAHIKRIQEETGNHTILFTKTLPTRLRKYLFAEKIPFIVDGKQIYLPFMYLYTQEINETNEEITKLSPIAQVLFLYYIYNDKKEITVTEAVKDLFVTNTAIFKGLKQLEALDLLNKKKDGVKAVIYSEIAKKDLFKKALPYLLNPIKRKVYVEKRKNVDLLKSSITALSEMTMLSRGTLETYATSEIAKWEKDGESVCVNPEEQIEIELWRYDPKKLSKEDIVDKLSLYLCMRNDGDDRVQIALDEMLDEFWRGNND